MCNALSLCHRRQKAENITREMTKERNSINRQNTDEKIRFSSVNRHYMKYERKLTYVREHILKTFRKKERKKKRKKERN